jgi:hypothetical protein
MTIAAGQTTGTFAVTQSPVTFQTSVTIKASLNGGSVSTILTVTT